MVPESDCVQISSMDEYTHRSHETDGFTEHSTFRLAQEVCLWIFFSLSCPIENSSQTHSSFFCLLLLYFYIWLYPRFLSFPSSGSWPSRHCWACVPFLVMDFKLDQSLVGYFTKF